MKLSMWMIANRLSELDMELEIREDAPVILKSARQVYASNCVHIYQSGEDLICNGEGDIIRIRNMDIRFGIELIQSVFDYFQDWMDDMITATRERDYPRVISLAWQVFQNPIVLFDGNNQVLGMTRQYPADSLDAEWAYLSRYGYASLNALQQMRRNYGNVQFWRHGQMNFNFSTPLLAYGGLTYCMYCNDASCGRMTVLQKDRPLNPGDEQLLNVIASLLEPILGQSYYENVFSGTNIFYNILFGLPYDKNALSLQLEYQNWKMEDIFQLTILDVQAPSGEKVRQENVDLLMQMIVHQSLSCVVMKKGSQILLLSGYNLARNAAMKHFFCTLRDNNPIRIAHSLPCRGLERVGYLYEQAQYALSREWSGGPGRDTCYFFDWAMDYLIETDSLEKAVAACIPTLTVLWDMQENKHDELFHTLKVYLEKERSLSKTAEALYTHRNTVQYRISKIQKLLDCDLEDAYVRSYCLLSIRVLELWKTHNHTKSDS